MPDPPSARRNATILGLFFLFPLLILSALFFFKRSSLKRAVANQAIYAAQASPEVAAEIGLPIQPGWPIQGKILSKGGEGNADLQIPLDGAHGNGVLLEWAQQDQGKWHICSLVFQSSRGNQIDLLESANSRCQPE